MVRAPFFDKNGVKKGAWSEDEDNKLRDYILKYGHWNWRELPKFAGLSRCGKSCRLRWVNYLRPNVKRGNYTEEEEDLIMKLHNDLGNKWSIIASKLPGRSDNEIKNHWHTHLKKCRKQNQTVAKKESTEISTESETDKKEQSLEVETSQFKVNEKSEMPLMAASSDQQTSESGLLSTESSSGTEFSSTLCSDSGENWVGDFWSEPFWVDDHDTFRDLSPLALVNHFLSPISPTIDEEFLW